MTQPLTADEQEVLLAIGKRVKRRTRQLGRTQIWLAQEAQVTARWLQYLSIGKSTRILGMIRVAGALGVSLEWLVTGRRVTDNDPKYGDFNEKQLT